MGARGSDRREVTRLRLTQYGRQSVTVRTPNPRIAVRSAFFGGFGAWSVCPALPCPALPCPVRCRFGSDIFLLQLRPLFKEGETGHATCLICVACQVAAEKKLRSRVEPLMEHHFLKANSGQPLLEDKAISDPNWEDPAKSLPENHCCIVYNGKILVGRVAAPRRAI